MAFQTLELSEEKGGQIQVLRLNRPQALNALNFQLLKELDIALSILEENSTARVLILTGAGEKAFVAGADIKEMQELTESQALEMAQTGQRIFQRMEDLKIPVIAAVNGFALGGGLELALSCDFIIASEKAKIGLPEVSLGLIPGYGGTQRLARSVGKAWARRLILTGEMISAQQAQGLGLVTEVLPPEQLLPTALKLAQVLASRGPLALKWAKQAVNQGFEKEQSLGLKLEAELFAQTFSTEDHNEGIAAFVEKRTAQFTGE